MALMKQMALQLSQDGHTQMGWHINVSWITDDLYEWNSNPKTKTPLNVTLPTLILPNYLRIPQIPTVHNTSV